MPHRQSALLNYCKCFAIISKTCRLLASGLFGGAKFNTFTLKTSLIEIIEHPSRDFYDENATKCPRKKSQDVKVY